MRLRRENYFLNFIFVFSGRKVRLRRTFVDPKIRVRRQNYTGKLLVDCSAGWHAAGVLKVALLVVGVGQGQGAVEVV